MTYHTLKRTYFYNFFPVKAEEEANRARRPYLARPARVLVEIRDLHPAPMLDPQNPWKVKKTLSHFEIATGRITISFQDSLEHVLRYWNFSMANHVALFGHKVTILVWDVTDEKTPRRYYGRDFYFQMTPSGNCILACTELMRNRNLKVEDYIGLYWDPKGSDFRIKVFYSNTR